MKCKTCGFGYVYKTNKALTLPVNQECPKCKRWTGEPIKHTKGDEGL